MKKTIPFMLIAALCCVMASWVAPALGMSDADKAVWGASEKVDTAFVVPPSEAAAIMGRAEALISQWGTLDGGMTAMKIQTVTDYLIETYNPGDIGEVGFNVTRTTLPGGEQISVSTFYYTGNIFSAGRDRKDADKRAHLLSYLLQVYANSLTATPPTTAPATPPSAPDVPSVPYNGTLSDLPSDLKAYLEVIHVQLAAGEYGQALSSLEELKSLIAEKQQQSDNKPATQLTGPPTPTGTVPKK